MIEMWRKHYNTQRPHSALGYRLPVPEAILRQMFSAQPMRVS